MMKNIKNWLLSKIKEPQPTTMLTVALIETLQFEDLMKKGVIKDRICDGYKYLQRFYELKRIYKYNKTTILKMIAQEYNQNFSTVAATFLHFCKTFNIQVK